MTVSIDVPTDEVPPPKVSRQGQGGGPKTAFGKAASSKNATTHGLAAKQARTLPDYFQNDVHERMFYYVAHHQPQCDDDNALCGLAAIGFVQHRNALSEQFQYLRVRSRRAQSCWALDRAVDAGLLAQKLPKRPGVVSLQLAGTYHGAIWLLDRWHHLARSLEGTGLWSEEEIQLAYDLLGRDALTRQHDPDRVVAGSLEERKELVAKRIARLQELVDGPLKELDAEQRLQAIRGQGYLDDPVYRRFDRYGNRALKLNRDCLAELERRRIARGLDAYNPDGTIATPPPRPGDPEVETDPDYRPRFYHLPEEELRANEPEAEKPRPIRNEPRAATPAPEPIRNEPAEPRRRPNAEEIQKAQRKLAEDRKAQDREKARLRAERKAAKAARKRNR
ncbi:MAG: hypothetical protein U0800_12055 [Isosphaeraceae bacterium]